MNRPQPDRYDLGWRRSDLVLLLALCVAGGGALALAARSTRHWFTSQPPISPSRIALASQKIDPNTATVASLRRLGGIGLVKAEAIVLYRGREGVRFRTADDLVAVPGIGPRTARRIAPYLRFPPVPVE